MTSTRTRRRLLTVAALAAVVAAGTAGAWAWSGSHPDTRSTAGAAVADPTPGASAAAATLVTEPADPAEVATDVPTSAAPTGTDVDVVVSYAGWDDATSAVEVNAFVGGVVEEGGTCTLRLTGGDAPVSVEVPAEADASTTTCGLMSTPGTPVPPGTYDAVVTYTSPSASGVSAGTSVEVPR